MSTPEQYSYSGPVVQRPWDARLARRLVAPLKDSWVTPNHLTTLRLVVGLAAAALLILSNFLDHTDGELARMSGKSSRIGHVYDLVSDAAVTILLFVAMGAGVDEIPGIELQIPPIALGLVAGCAIALIFFLRMRIEEMVGKAANQQASLAGFETEDVLYLLPLITLSNGVMLFLMAAALCAPLFALWVMIEYRRVLRQLSRVAR
jgi:archaetidylinositol phosphate synthase